MPNIILQKGTHVNLDYILGHTVSIHVMAEAIFAVTKKHENLVLTTKLKVNLSGTVQDNSLITS